MALRGLPGVPLCRLLAIDDLDEVEPDVPPVVAPPDQPHAALVVVAVQEQLVAIALPDFAVQGGEEPDLGGVLDHGVDACMVDFENPLFCYIQVRFYLESSAMPAQSLTQLVAVHYGRVPRAANVERAAAAVVDGILGRIVAVDADGVVLPPPVALRVPDVGLAPAVVVHLHPLRDNP